MFERFTRRWCHVYSISPGDLWLLTHPDEADQYVTYANDKTIRGELECIPPSAPRRPGN